MRHSPSFVLILLLAPGAFAQGGIGIPSSPGVVEQFLTLSPADSDCVFQSVGYKTIDFPEGGPWRKVTVGTSKLSGNVFVNWTSDKFPLETPRAGGCVPTDLLKPIQLEGTSTGDSGVYAPVGDKLLFQVIPSLDESSSYVYLKWER